MNILIFFPTNNYSNYIVTQCREINKKYGKVYFVTLASWGEMHKHMQKSGVECHILPSKQNYPSFLRFIYSAFYLIQFIKKHNIKICFSHMHPCMLITTVVQFFVSVKMIQCRHHSDTAVINGTWKERMGDKFINKFAKYFLVPSTAVYNQILKEGVNASIIYKIPYMYDFDQFPHLNNQNVSAIRASFANKFIISKIARHVLEKRHHLLLEAYSNLLNKKLLPNTHLLFLSDGPLTPNLIELTNRLHLNENVSFIGLKTNVIDYIEASDLIVHLSNSEASNSLVKEAGLRKKNLIVCREVGDFDDYITEECAFKINKNIEMQALENALLEAYQETIMLPQKKGKLLCDQVFEHFDYRKVLPLYDVIFQ